LCEIQAFAQLDELEDVAAGTAGETLEYLLDRIDAQTWAMVVVKRAQTDHFATFFV